MVLERFSSFFITGTGASAGLLGLLFVAISIAPEHIFSESSVHHSMATNALIALINAFFISFGALIPSMPLGWLSLGVSVLSLISSLGLAWTLLYLELNPRLVRRRIFLVVITFIIYGFECWYSIQLLFVPSSSGALYGLVYVLLAVFGVGLLLSYGVLGAHPLGFRKWLGPRRYTDDKKETVS